MGYFSRYWFLVVTDIKISEAIKLIGLMKICVGRKEGRDEFC